MKKNVKNGGYGILHYLQENKKFGIISGYCTEKNTSDNRCRHEALEQEVAGFSPVVLFVQAGYRFMYKHAAELYEERYLLVPDLPFYNLLQLARKYKQPTVLFYDTDGFNLVRSDNGHVLHAIGINRYHPRYTVDDVTHTLLQLFKSRAHGKLEPEIAFIHQTQLNYSLHQ